MAILELQGVRKAFGAQEVIRGVRLEVLPGEFVVLVGPSGSGKTTLLRLVAGLEKLTAGEVLLDARPISHLPPQQRNMAMVFQHYALYPHMTVERNLAFALRMRNESAARIAERVGEAADLLGLRPLLKRYPAQLSGGQQQRVAIGRALVRKPRLFLFDEPLSNLDGNLRLQMRTELKTLHRNLRTTSLFVTHDQTEAMALADRIVVLREGHIEQVGTPLEIYDRPATTFVAGFIGAPAMNLVPGIVQGGQVRTADGTLLPLGRRVAENRQVIYGFRPEACAVARSGHAAARIDAVEHMGPTVHLHARLGDSSVYAVTSEREGWHAGQPVDLRPDPAKVRLFDPVSGNAIEPA